MTDIVCGLGVVLLFAEAGNVCLIKHRNYGDLNGYHSFEIKKKH